jgi:hypothetical protein
MGARSGTTTTRARRSPRTLSAQSTARAADVDEPATTTAFQSQRQSISDSQSTCRGTAARRWDCSCQRPAQTNTSPKTNPKMERLEINAKRASSRTLGSQLHKVGTQEGFDQSQQNTKRQRRKPRTELVGAARAESSALACATEQALVSPTPPKAAQESVGKRLATRTRWLCERGAHATRTRHRPMRSLPAALPKPSPAAA